MKGQATQYSAEVAGRLGDEDPSVRREALGALGYAPPIAELRMGGPLSAAQLRSFAEEGVLVLTSFVDEATLQLWDAQMAEQLEGDPADSATWAGGPANPQLTPALKDLPQMQAVLRQLGAGAVGAEGHVVLRSLRQMGGTIVV